MRAWAFGSIQYVDSAVTNMFTHLQKRGEKLPYKAPTLILSGYWPEINISSELSKADTLFYQKLIGVIRWIVELGRVDIDVKVSMMSSHLALTQSGHLQELYHIFPYLKAHSNAKMVFNTKPIRPDM